MPSNLKPIPAFPGYFASTDGIIWSAWGTGSREMDTERLRPLKTAVSHDGYHSVTLCRNGKKCYRSVHRLIAYVFIGDVPDGKHVCHYDGDPSNNNVSNLRIDTPAGNAADKERHGTLRRGEDHPTAKLTERQVYQIRTWAKLGMPYVKIAKRFGISDKQVSNIVRRIKWAHLPDEPVATAR